MSSVSVGMSMNNLDNCSGYALFYLVTAIISVPICVEVIGFIAVRIEPCSGYDCMMHSLLSLLFGFLAGRVAWLSSRLAV